MTLLKNRTVILTVAAAVAVVDQLAGTLLLPTGKGQGRHRRPAAASTLATIWARRAEPLGTGPVDLVTKEGGSVKPVL